MARKQKPAMRFSVLLLIIVRKQSQYGKWIVNSRAK